MTSSRQLTTEELAELKAQLEECDDTVLVDTSTVRRLIAEVEAGREAQCELYDVAADMNVSSELIGNRIRNEFALNPPIARQHLGRQKDG